MKGPRIRSDLDVRRIWKCPACQTTRRTQGDVQAVRCTCGEGQTFMSLLEAPRLRPLIPPVKPLVQEFAASELVGDDPAPAAPPEGVPPAASPASLDAPSTAPTEPIENGETGS